MKKIYHLGNCDTCQAILTEVNAVKSGAVLQEIKTEKITADQLDEMKQMAGSYEALFSRRALKYRGLGLHEKKLSEKDYRKWILEEYTFLKRPVAIVNDKIFIGNTKGVVVALKEALAAAKR
ncbi:arsenate reductase family protein [Flavihumibacter petaseus]|uniref:ArsC family protein n=1 Tax=Flavihumibacter petaseus NBRC 106054 TaxID=1220578 RepID=A0A0E9MZJ6_9BACT|nr:ArsC/Spx/MgsR family protein [Flavihumibacter petaseus]GAO42821.1 ArsC family protein [Flavihumibacter petaseus NBRC 106054]